MNKFQVFIDENKDILNDFAKKYIEKTDMPELLKKSISYSLVNDGKKIRPLSFLYLLKYYGEDFAEYFDVALAIELVHTYSLVHDYRWGKLTNHKVFGQDVAVLTGDAMLTLAFEVLSNSNIKPDLKVKLISQFANYSGAMGMIAGQIYDIKQKEYEVNADYLRRMHSLKTGKLIELPLDFACQIAGKVEELSDINSFGKELGIAYQIKDDILDYYGDFENIGKLPSDEDMITYLSFYGIEQCEELLEKHTTSAIEIARKLKNCELEDFSNYLLKRNK